MTQPTRTKLYREVEGILRATGLPWSIECGTRHAIITLDGQRVGVMSKGHHAHADSKKIASSIRQLIKRK